jgi:hypothetical protein
MCDAWNDLTVPKMTETPSYHGFCFCKALSWVVTGSPILTVYCHCTTCQRLHAAPFIHTIHYPKERFQWTHPNHATAFLERFQIPDKPWKSRVRCKKCGVMIATENTKTNAYSVFGPVLERDDSGKIMSWEQLKPTAHMFYGTRLLDVNDELPKWQGYSEQSARLDS